MRSVRTHRNAARWRPMKMGRKCASACLSAYGKKVRVAIPLQKTNSMRARTDLCAEAATTVGVAGRAVWEAKKRTALTAFSARIPSPPPCACQPARPTAALKTSRASGSTREHRSARRCMAPTASSHRVPKSAGASPLGRQLIRARYGPSASSAVAKTRLSAAPEKSVTSTIAFPPVTHRPPVHAAMATDAGKPRRQRHLGACRTGSPLPPGQKFPPHAQVETLEYNSNPVALLTC